MWTPSVMARTLVGFMDWITAAVISSLVLGGYDLSIKHAVLQNAVVPVLFLSNVCSATIWLTLMGLQQGTGALPEILHVESLTLHRHLFLFGKSALVATAWIFTYFAMKHLPVSLAAPVRSMAPLVTFSGALLALGERLGPWQLVGVGLTLLSFVGLSFAGREEGVHFTRNRWVWWLVAGTFFNGLSALYDKFLLGRFGFHASTVQAWFSIYLALIFLPLALGWKFRLWQRNEFHWRWSVLGVSLFLLVADFLYFSALRDPDALVSVVSSVRRGSTLIAFCGGLWLYREGNGLRKLPAVAGILAGILLTLWR